MAPRGADTGAEQFSTPHGTVTVVLDNLRGCMEVIADPVVHPLDWDVVCGLLRMIGVRLMGEPAYVRGMDVWTVHLSGALRAPLQRSPRPSGRGLLRCEM